jgi:hypothetical protein
MNQDFIRLKDTEGTLLLSHTNRNLGCKVTTKEIIFQRPHCTYQILFEDIVSMIPHDVPAKPVMLPLFGNSAEKVSTSFASSYYKISADRVRVYNRSGTHERKAMDLIVPLHQLFLKYFARYCNLTIVQ